MVGRVGRYAAKASLGLLALISGEEYDLAEDILNEKLAK